MKSLIAWFVDNRVAANLLMIMLIVGGVLTAIDVKQEVFPDAAPDAVSVSVIYPGATPEEVEEGICIKIEEAIDGIEGIKKITSTASEDFGSVMAELHYDADKQAVLDDVKSRVDAISTFPADAEKPVTVDVEMNNVVMNVVLSGDVDPMTLKRTAQRIRDEMAALPEISRVEVTNAPDYEISIEVSEDQLRRYGLSFDAVTAAVRAYSLNLAGGTIKSSGGEILLRSDSQAYVGREFEEILLLRSAEGTRVILGDVAEVRDGFEDVDQWSLLDGKPSLTITAFRVGEQSTPVVAKEILDYVEARQATLPAGVLLTIQKDWSDLLRQRLDLLLKNGRSGLILIFVILTLFLRLRLAFWVALGIPAALLGAVWLLPASDTSINMLSLFGFIVVLGILVDDAIVVAENIHYHNRRGLAGAEAAKKGTFEVMKPVILAVLTTVAAFVPMLTLPGQMGKFAQVIPIVVICALLFSLVESLLILPKHLSHGKAESGEPARHRSAFVRTVRAATGCFGKGLEWFVEHVYRPLLEVGLRWRYATFAAGVALVILTAGIFMAGMVKFSFFPPIEGDEIMAHVMMPPGTPVERTAEAVDRIDRAVETLRKRYEKERPGTIIKHVLKSVGSQPLVAVSNHQGNVAAPTGPHLGEVFIELFPPHVRQGVTAEDLMRDLREEVGVIPGIRELTFKAEINQAADPIAVRFRGGDLVELRVAADRLKDRLGELPGVFDITDDLVPGKREIVLSVTPRGEALGITQGELARQVRQAFYGDEAQRIQRGKDDIKVMIRYPKADRRTVAALEDMRIRLADGAEVPFATVARAEWDRGPASIHRAEGSRAVTVTADVDLAVANANEIVDKLRDSVLPELLTEHPRLSYDLVGEQEQQAETMGGLFQGAILAMLLIFTLLALAFNSFIQPVIVILAIPFGMVGAVLGHLLLGHDLTMLSTIGLLAMAGVVVNDSMIMIDFVNRYRQEKGRSALRCGAGGGAPAIPAHPAHLADHLRGAHAASAGDQRAGPVPDPHGHLAGLRRDVLDVDHPLRGARGVSHSRGYVRRDRAGPGSAAPRGPGRLGEGDHSYRHFMTQGSRVLSWKALSLSLSRFNVPACAGSPARFTTSWGSFSRS